MRWIFRFVTGLSAHWLSRLGVALTTSTFLAFIFLEALSLLGVFTNAYLGLITYLVFPTLFVVGLILIPIGWRAYVKSTGKTAGELLSEQFAPDGIEGGLFGSRLLKTIGLLTIINLVFLGAASLRTLHFMDEARFCGTACHKVMNPEWVTYQQSPHAHVKCVECHVGEGFQALVDSKINGAYQIISLTFSLYEKPIPTPVKNLRPARETCENCHWPDKFTGNRLKTIVHYGLDRASTPKYTTLNVKIGTGEEGIAKGSHWHISERNQVRYLAADEKRFTMKWAEVRQPDGEFRRYRNQVFQGGDDEDSAAIRIMDCVDCHNRATHIYELPEYAIDDRIQRELMHRTLPYAKRAGLSAITKNYRDKATGYGLIAVGTENYYRDNHPGVFQSGTVQLDSMIAVLRNIYHRNIHPGMEITWGSYPNHIAHRKGPGCFRCHNPYMVDDEGYAISDECTLCHSILAIDAEEPFKYLFPIDTTNVDHRVQQYLLEEFIKEH
jgi:hypothetical protein